MTLGVAKHENDNKADSKLSSRIQEPGAPRLAATPLVVQDASSLDHAQQPPSKSSTATTATVTTTHMCVHMQYPYLIRAHDTHTHMQTQTQTQMDPVHTGSVVQYAGHLPHQALQHPVSHTLFMADVRISGLIMLQNASMIAYHHI